ncbi:MAG TPA: YifB family Mg chelatase-like AAA ATPase [Tepiditoga sp.]|nr:YifB family Mg chelatase-like AAA ATPase [Thermotogota bacterium]HOO74853.1 YifB family Mg chelatase-like AAA ATPase [Tepiditoga sp.]
MKYSNLKTGSVNGYNVEDIIVEIDINSKSTFQTFKIVGLPSASVLESEKRVISALRNSGFTVPNGSIVANLSPSSLKKEGTHFDLPLACAVLEASGQIKKFKENVYLFGELGLNGEVRAVSGIALFLMAIKEKNKEAVFIIPRENQEESSFIDFESVFVIDRVSDLEKIGNGEISSFSPVFSYYGENEDIPDFSDIHGQYIMKRAAEIAVSGFHNLLLRGSPGSGKTMVARRLPGIMPDMEKEEIIESTKIYSVAGYINKVINRRPFRSPHHSASSASIIGGGSNPKPGEISLAHNGILFMDEFPEYKSDVIESLRQPMEDGFITVTRSKSVAVFPAKFMLVAAQNPCPCGYYGDKEKECTCSLNSVLSYNRKISGPIMDRIDIIIDVPRVKIDELMEKASGETSSSIKERVTKCKNFQIMRQGKLNGKLTNKELKEYANMDSDAELFLKNAASVLKLSARSVNRVIRVSRTISDSFESGKILKNHISEALNYHGKDIIS